MGFMNRHLPLSVARVEGQSQRCADSCCGRPLCIASRSRALPHSINFMQTRWHLSWQISIRGGGWTDHNPGLLLTTERELWSQQRGSCAWWTGAAAQTGNPARVFICVYSRAYYHLSGGEMSSKITLWHSNSPADVGYFFSKINSCHISSRAASHWCEDEVFGCGFLMALWPSQRSRFRLPTVLTAADSTRVQPKNPHF